MQSNISIIPSHQIDQQKWNNCIANNSNGLIYSQFEYLSFMSNEWVGLVINDYATVFPITIKTKFGIRYNYMPAFIQQLGFVGNLEIDFKSVENVLFSFVKYGSPYLNFSNALFANEIDCPLLSNYIINLNSSYQAIKSNYKKSIDYSLSKAGKANLVFLNGDDIDEVVNYYQQYNQNNMQHVAAADYANFIKLCKSLQQNDQLFIRKVVDQNNQLLSVVLLLKDNKRYYNLINYTTPQGRNNEANYFLYDNVLKELSNQPMLFDFEGSDLLGVKSFYEKFGAVNQPYFHWHFNKLPFWLKWIKK